MEQLIAKKWPPILLLAISVLIVWGHTLRFDFVWDDKYFISELPSVRSLKNIPGMFYQLEAQAVRSEDFVVFRPVRTAHYAVLFFLSGKSEPQPRIYHLANVLWHGATAMMLFAAAAALLRRLCVDLRETESRLWAFFIALAFTVHPVVSEVVCWAKSLDDILAAFFTLATLHELLKSPEDRSALWRGTLLFVLAVYSKESAVPFVLVPLMLFLKLHRLSWKRSLYRTLPFLLVAAFYVVHRHLVIGRSSQTDPISGTYGQTLLDMLPVVLKYFRLLFGIPPFFIDYTYLRGGYKFLSAEVLAGLLLLAVLVLAGALAWRAAKWRLAGFGLIWTGLFLLPVSNLLPMKQYLAERFLYLPLIGWLMAVVGAVLIARQKRIFQYVWLGVVLLWGVTAWNRSWIWQDTLTLFVRSSQEGPKTGRVENNAVAAILQLPHITNAFKLDDNKLSFIGQIDPESLAKVERTFTEALELFPDNHTILSALGMTLATSGRSEQALPLFEKAAGLEPANAGGWLNLARAALASGQLPKAGDALEKVFALEPDNPFALALSFECQWRTGDYVAARETATRWNRIAGNEHSARALENVEKKLKEQNASGVTAPGTPP